MAGVALIAVLAVSKTISDRGLTLIELIIVVAVLAVLMIIAMPSYRYYVLRVHRAEAVRMLMQASMCQERINASRGSYDISLCKPASSSQHYELSYRSTDKQGQTYIATAAPLAAQSDDPCGSLSVDQNGNRSISAKKLSVTKCWNGR